MTVARADPRTGRRWRALALLVGVIALAAGLASFGAGARTLRLLLAGGRAPEPSIDALEPSGRSLDVWPTLADWPRFLGPRGDGVVEGVLLARDWSEQAPQLLWRRRVGPGFASFAVQGDIAVTQEQRGALELVVAYALEDGEPVWVHADRVRFASPVAGVGPRATPAIDGARVFTLGATGILNALDLATGERYWWRDVLADSGAAVPAGGKSNSPLVVDGRVVIAAGGANGRTLIAYDGLDGEIVWSAGDAAAGYASPLLTTLAGRRQIVLFDASGVAGYDPAGGGVLWRYPWPREAAHVVQPLPLDGDSLIVAGGRETGLRRLRLLREGERLRVQSVWHNPEFDAGFSQLLRYRECVYGIDGGALACVDPATGRRLWRRGRYGRAQLLLVEDLLLIQTDEGELVLVAPGPRGPRELAHAPGLEQETWNIPTLVGDRLLMRNDEEAALFRLPLR